MSKYYIIQEPILTVYCKITILLLLTHTLYQQQLTILYLLYIIMVRKISKNYSK